jgi:hypothetical protein
MSVVLASRELYTDRWTYPARGAQALPSKQH